ncbi:MAG: hypothetical protein HUJ65_07240, partial [Oscillospiraceae bacterium]|nr:hypothetical protein [Oscillospiraceae bacterium]
MTIQEYNKYGADLERMFKLDTMPIAFKFYEKAAENFAKFKREGWLKQDEKEQYYI